MKKNRSTETKTCEACGAQFSCGAANEDCWCFAIEVKPEVLSRLPDDYQNCLCRKCLENSAANEINRTHKITS